LTTGLLGLGCGYSTSHQSGIREEVERGHRAHRGCTEKDREPGHDRQLVKICGRKAAMLYFARFVSPASAGKDLHAQHPGEL